MVRGFLYTLSAFVLWGVFPFYFKAIDMIDPVEIIAHRIVWSLLFVSVLLLLLRQTSKLQAALRNPRTLLIFTCSALFVAANWGIYVYIIVKGQTLEASLGYFINPLINVALGALILREKLRPMQKVSIAVATAGVLWIIFDSGMVPILGIVMALFFGLYGLIRKTAPLPSLEGLALETLILTPLAFGYMSYLFTKGNLGFLEVDLTVKSLLLLAGPITAIPLLLFAAGARLIPYSLVGILQYVSPTIVFLIGIFCFKEPFSTSLLIGFCIIWTAVALFTWDSLKTLK